MATKITVPWGDTTHDNFYLDFINIENKEVLVTSDENSSGITRKKEISLQVSDNNHPNSIIYIQIVQEVQGTLFPLVTFNKVAAVYNKTKVLTY